MPISTSFNGAYTPVEKVAKKDRGFAPDGSGFRPSLIPLVEELDRVVMETPEDDKTDTYIHPSSVLECARKTFFYIKRAPGDDKRDPRWERDSKVGTAIHKLILEKWLMATPLVEVVEYPVYIEGHNVRGTVDAIIEWQDERYLLDLKTVDHKKFEEGAFGAKFPKYKAQLSLYAAATGIKKAIILLFNRSTGEYGVPVEFDVDPTQQQQLLDRVDKLTANLRDNELPIAEDLGKFTCGLFCPFTRLCDLEESTRKEFPFEGVVSTALKNELPLEWL